MTNSIPPSVYKPLDPKKKEIRLLQLLSHPADDQIYASCQLSTASLQTDKILFTALSYVWGDASVTKTIILNGIKCQVTESLASALRNLAPRLIRRHNWSPLFLLWADALCINQSDILERNQQVSMMGDIYSSAFLVYTWLGTEAWIPTALETLHIVYNEVQDANNDISILSEMKWLQRNPTLHALDFRDDARALIPNRHWMALRYFIDLPYWSRMWIFQEMVLSRQIIFIGPNNIYKREIWLEKAVRAMRLIAESFLIGQPRPKFLDEDTWKSLRRLHMFRNSIKQVHGLLRAKELYATCNGGSRAQLCLLSAFNRHVQATDSRDYYYSLVGVAGLSLEPDYSSTKSVQEACLDFVEAFLEATCESSMPLLFLHDAIRAKESRYHGLPSWGPRYHVVMTNVTRGADHNADADLDVFVNLAETARSRPFLTRQKTTLCALGVPIATIKFTGNRLDRGFHINGAMSACLLNFAQRHGPIYITGRSAAETLFTTLQQKLDGPYDQMKGQILLAFLTAQILDSTGICDEDIRVWVDIGKAYLDGQLAGGLAEMDLQFLTEIVLQEWSETFSLFGALEAMRLFETEEGYIGIAPFEVSVGDVLCVLNGFHYPVILRLMTDHYVFVGVCFVLGLMSGEAKSIVESESSRPRVFEIR